MKTALIFLFTTFISIACLMSALGSPHPVLLYLIGFGVWGLFLWHCSLRMKKKEERRMHEQQFQEFMRQQTRKPQR
ncbi:hypothetical protein [Mucilaginibacter gotjawali]|uniref:Membrane protein YesL n=2 Tax=Mucilaginibacter gotjawali TaxID=1550579 RepID=A0A839SK83_9SPHI|nr:hypothetical protein [Mucilaginibacter gotjawali]MBB3058751.1 putative membrane protein YesL [Mucilaginibacter gotjawali]BAU55646.1 hypothetical protein MgSA37_03837 [Mucilaginibacter gotjawali]